MHSTTIESDDYYSVDRRVICFTIMLSLSVHAVVYYLLPVAQNSSKLKSSKLTHVARFRLIPTLPKSETARPLDQLKEVTGNAKRRVSLQRKPVESQTDALVKTPPLSLSRDILLQAIRATDPASEPAPVLSENEAVVMDSALLETVNRAKRRTGFVAEAPGNIMDTTFNGGSWSEFVKYGDSCFQVNQANPLDSTSREMWYRVQCPD